MRYRPTRRGILLGLAGTLGGIGVAGAGSLFACQRLVTADAGSAAMHLAATLPEVFAPERLARHWQGTTNPVQLLAEIRDRSGLAHALELECIASRCLAVRSQFARDFASEDIVLVDRLMVARSECLIAAFCLGADQKPFAALSVPHRGA